MVSENTYMKLKPAQPPSSTGGKPVVVSAAVSTSCCPSPALTSHLSMNKRHLSVPTSTPTSGQGQPTKFPDNFVVTDKPPTFLTSSPCAYENSGVPASPSDSMCSSASGKESGTSSVSFKDAQGQGQGQSQGHGGQGQGYGAGAGAAEMYSSSHMER